MGLLKGSRQTSVFLSLMSASLVLNASPVAARGFGFGNSISDALEGVSLQSQSSLGLSILSNEVEMNGFGLDSTSSAIRQALHDRGLNSSVAISAREKLYASRLKLNQDATGAGTVTDYDYLVGGYKVCSVAVRSVEHVSGETVIVGEIPQIFSVLTPTDADWPDMSESAERAIQDVSASQGHPGDSVRVGKSERCLFNEQGMLEPVWNFVLTLDGFQYEVFSSSSRVFKATPRSLDATATVQAYDPNILTGSLKNYSITVSGDQTLTNTYVTTSVYTGAARVTSASNTFNYTGSNTASAEASVFAYANQQLDFAVSNGYEWSGPKPMVVQVYAVVGNTTNNALYTPADPSDSDTVPYISVGEGDGRTLRNLAYDADVVSHEFGHHVIYQSITTIAGEGLVIHEGLADFLSFSRTGDACLGESICPDNSNMSSCRIFSNKCLRSGENSLVYNDSTYQSYAQSPHMQGTLVSGFFWDMRKSGAIPADTLTKLTFQAIKYLPSSSSIKNLVAALLYADSVNGETYRAAIVAAAEKRGIGPTTLGIDLANIKSSLASEQSTTSGGDSGSKKKGGVFGCTVSGSFGGGSGFLWLVLMALPLLFTRRRSKQNA